MEQVQNGKKSSAVSNVGALAMNVIRSVGIIMANKQLMSPAGYDFTFVHWLLAEEFFIRLSRTLAIFCNISQCLRIGRFSAVSFRVLGHMKTVCVLTLGWLLFDSQLTVKNIMAMALTVIGMVLYSRAVEVEKQVHVKGALAKTSLTEEETRLLREGVENSSVKGVELGHMKV